MRLLWGVLARLLRHTGWGAVLVPVAAIGMAVFGLSLWTIAAVVLAVIVALGWPAVAGALVPVAMVCLGLSGLVVAAATPGLSGIWAGPKFSYSVVQVNAPVALRLSGRTAQAQLRPAAAAAGRGNAVARRIPRTAVVKRSMVVRKGTMRKTAGPQVAAGSMAGQAYAVAPVPPPPLPPPPAFAKGAGGNWTGKAVFGPLTKPGPRYRLIPNPGWWRGKLLVPVALILLTLGLWLVPRTLVGPACPAGRPGLGPADMDAGEPVGRPPGSCDCGRADGVRRAPMDGRGGRRRTRRGGQVAKGRRGPGAARPGGLRGPRVRARGELAIAGTGRTGATAGAGGDVRRPPRQQPADGAAGRRRGKRVPGVRRVAGPPDPRRARPNAAGPRTPTPTWLAGFSG